ncbi:DoxX family membrane protein [Corynebacterium flavescens]|uniref:DoxX family membrane protein n=1 Tax=Corynebacterium flavescens TaxID=28028 RepID=UPI003F929BD0
MSDKNTPDKATDLNEDVDVPTYSPSARKAAPEPAPAPADKEPPKPAADSVPAGSKTEAIRPPVSKEQPKKDVFSWAGRAAPQKIEPVASEPTEIMPAPAAQPEAAQQDAEPAQSAEPAETEVLSVSKDEPAAAYHDEDFAPAAASETASPQAHPETLLAPAAMPTPSQDDDIQDAAAGEEETATESAEGYRAYGRRGTLDFGLFVARIALSAYLIVAGLGTFFGLGGNEGLSGLEAEYAGYAMPAVLAIVVPTLQLVAGAFLLFGLVFPFAAAVGVVVTAFGLLHTVAFAGAGFDVFAWPAQVWLALILVLLAVALQFSGPGFVSLDFKRSWARRPLASSWIWVVVAVAAAAALWWFGAGVNPLS